MGERAITHKHTVLVTGAEGFLGRHLLPRLAMNGHRVHGTHHPSLQPPDIKGVTWLASDLTAVGAEDGWPKQCTSVIYLAQARQWRDFPQNAPDVLAINVLGALRSIEYARQVGASQFLYLSSGSVYSRVESPAGEDDPVMHNCNGNFYIASKRAAESLLGPYSACLNVITVRLFFPYGSGQNPNMLFPNLVKRVREGQPIVLHGPDGLHFNPTVAEDVAETLVRLLHAERSAVVNVGGPEALTLRAVGEAIGRELGLPVRFEEHAEEPTRVMVGKTDRLRELLGWTPQTPFAVGLRHWLRENEA